MNLGPMELSLIFFAILVLFGYKKLPDASRSLGRSLRIFKGEMRGLKEDDALAPRAGAEPGTAETGARFAAGPSAEHAMRPEGPGTAQPRSVTRTEGAA